VIGWREQQIGKKRVANRARRESSGEEWRENGSESTNGVGGEGTERVRVWPLNQVRKLSLKGSFPGLVLQARK